MLRIAEDCVKLGHKVTIYTGEWRGDKPQDHVNVQILPIKGLLNHQRHQSLVDGMQAALKSEPVDCVIGFNRMEGLDVYYAADPCFAKRAHEDHGLFYRLSSRYRWFAKCERSVFKPEGSCELLILSENEKLDFQHWYKTPSERFHLLPPFISTERMKLHDKTQMRRQLRQEFGFGEQDHVLLLVGSGFRTKGLDRAIKALAALPLTQRGKTRLLAVGQDNPKAYQRLAEELGLGDRVHIIAGRSDIPKLMQGADLLVHPARRELAGHVLLEAMLSKLPVLVTDVCGYASHIQAAGAGIVVDSPFNQVEFNEILNKMLNAPKSKWEQAGLEYMQAILHESSKTAEADLIVEFALNKKKGLKN